MTAPAQTRLAGFAAALLDPDAPLPAGIIDPQGRPAPKRFSVYRNNVASSLTRVLEAGFPVIRQLVGEAFFAAMAGEFLRRHPPKTRMMMLYGDEFAGFLEAFPPVAHLPYLPDMARLEQAIRESYHAADAAPLALSDLAALPEATLLATRFRLSPALRLIRSAYPVHGIWAAHQPGGTPPVARAEDVAVIREGFDPVPVLLAQGVAAALAALQAGAPLGAALQAAADPGAALALILTNGLLIERMP